MSAYIEPIKIAIVLFPLLAFVLSFIFFIYEYRKYGTFLFRRACIIYSFVFYLLCAYFLVILPLPPKEEVAKYTSQYLELRPFYFISRFLEDTVLNIHDSTTYLPALKQGVVLEPIFNILLLVPFGVYLRYYFKCSFKKVVLLSFFLSLFFELTQLSSLYFIYPRPYRLADVNDLITNTFGGMLGYWSAPLVTFFLPSRDRIDELAYEKGQSVSFIRRFVAFVIDWFFLSICQTVALSIIRFLPAYKNFSRQHPLLVNRLWFFLMIFFVFMLIPKITNGKTIGKKIVRIKIVEEGHEKIRFKALFIRYSCLYIMYGLISLYFMDASTLLNSSNHQLQVVSLMLLFFCLMLLFLFLFNLIYVIVRQKKQLFYEKASHTYIISTIQRKSKKDTKNY